MTIAPFVTPLLTDYIRQAGQEWIKSQTRPTYLSSRGPDTSPSYITNFVRTAAPSGPSTYYNNPRMYRQYKRTYKKAPRKRYSPTKTTLLVRQPKVEIKSSIQNNVIVSTATTTGSPVLCTNIASGTALGDRDGNVIRTLDIRWTGAVTKDAGTDPYIVHRLIIFQWDQGFVSPTASSVLANNTFLANYNQADARSYRILHDGLYKCESGAGVATAYAADYVPIKGYAKLNKEVTFQSTSGTSGDSTIWAMYISTSTSGSCNLNVQIRFVDM